MTSLAKKSSVHLSSVIVWLPFVCLLLLGTSCTHAPQEPPDGVVLDADLRIGHGDFTLSDAFVSAWLAKYREGQQAVAEAPDGRKWFVSLAGSDSGPGSRQQPFASIQHAINQAQPGDRIIIGPGTYYEQLVIQRGGSPGRPLIIEGSRDSEGGLATVISAGQAVDPSGWEPAFELGAGIYRNESLPFEPHLLAVDGKFVSHIHAENWTRLDQGPNDPRPWWRESNKKGDPMALLRLPEEGIVETHSSNNRSQLRFWDAVGGIFVFDPERGPDVVYLRLRGGVDPRGHATSISRGGAVVTIDNAGHVVLRGLRIEMGHMGVSIRGAQAIGNVVEACHILHGPQRRIQVSHKATDTLIRNNHIEMGFYGTRPGAWGGGHEQTAAREYLYDLFKRLATSGTGSSDRSIYVENGAHNTTIVGNYFDAGLVAVSSSGNTGLVVKGNVIRDFSSVGLSVITGSVDAHFHDNIIYNCNVNVRLHRLNQGNGHEVYIYRNLLLQEEGIGTQFFTHSLNAAIMERMNIDIATYEEAEIAVYQNTVIGGNRFWAQTSGTGLRDGLPGVRILNNIITTGTPFWGRMEGANFAAFDYNWLHFPEDWQEWPWFGRLNIDGSHHPIDPSRLLSPATLPAAVRNKGLDLSRPFTINGTEYPPLPGMKAAQTSNKAPNMGLYP